VIVVAATLLALTDIYAHLLGVLTFEAVFVMAWVSTLVTYIGAYQLDSRQQQERDLSLDRALPVNVVGVAALIIAVSASTPFAFGVGGAAGKGLAPIIGMSVAAFTVLGLRWCYGPDPRAAVYAVQEVASFLRGQRLSR
jgi:hypothetical protein